MQDQPESLYVPKTKPYDHQSSALSLGWSRSHYGWLMEMGTGKSKVAIDNIGMLRQAGRIERVLIVAPKGTYSNWARKEIPAHMPDLHLSTTHVHLWQGAGTKRERDQLAAFERHDGMQILVMNTEALASSAKAENYAEKFVKRGRCMIIVDESSTIKNPQAMRTKKLVRLAKFAPYRRIATGTPVTKSPLDLWAQFEFLSPGCLGHRSYYSFRARYAVTESKVFGGRKIDVVVGHRDTKQLSDIVARHAYVVRKEDCLDLPQKVYTVREVQLTPEQSRIYGEIRDWATSEIEAGKFVTATEVITQILRLHQVVCGHVTDEGGETRDIPTARLDSLSEIVQEVQDKTIVWCSYRRDIDKVVKRLREDGLRVVQYDGSTNQEGRQEAIYRFQGEAAEVVDGQVVGVRHCPESEQADVFVGTPSAGGYGITLTAARTVIYYSNTYDLEKRLQSEDRAHRIGQTRSVLYIDLVSPGTVDEKILEALRRKQTLANLIMEGPERVREMFGV